MRDIPVFTTQNGVASLILKKIPYTKEAFVHVRDSLTCAELLKECIDLCRMAGAEIVYATGHNSLTAYPLACVVHRYRVARLALPKTDAIALPATMEQKDWWRKVYNQKMEMVHAAAPLALTDTEQLIHDGQAFCVCKDCLILGIGVACDGMIQAVASLQPGAGRDVVLALAATLATPDVTLHVAGTNSKALRLYNDLGFLECGALEHWYKIF